jgi:hypothetical protein
MGYEIARFDHKSLRGFVKFNPISSLLIVEFHNSSCSPVELRLCYESLDDHLFAQQPTVTHAVHNERGDFGVALVLSIAESSSAEPIVDIDVTARCKEQLHDGSLS